MEHERKRRPAEQASHHRQTQKRKSSGGIVRRVLFIVGTLLLVGICTGAMMLGIFLKYVDTTLASSLQVRAEDYTMSLSSVIYYQDKESGEWVEYQTVYGDENRIWVDFDEMPDALWQAAVAIEGKNAGGKNSGADRNKKKGKRKK